ncbi:hypothetical protein VPHD479_0145 [Vibrio phage D479]
MKHLEFKRKNIADGCDIRPLWVYDVVVPNPKDDILEHLETAYFNENIRCIRIVKRGTYKPWTILVIRTTQSNGFKFVEYATKIASLKEAMYEADTMLNPEIVTEEDMMCSLDNYKL